MESSQCQNTGGAMDRKKAIEEKRKEANRNLLKRMKDGGSLQLIPTEMTWYPPRPKIEKDKKAMAKCYNMPEEEENKCEPKEES